jgi:hypothetical protein
MCFPTLPLPSHPSHADLAFPSDLVLPSEWDHDTEMLNEEELSATSHEEACKVLEQWQTYEDQYPDIMEVDEQIGSNLLGDEIFGDPCLSPTGPLEELHMMSNDSDACRYFTPFGEETRPPSIPSMPSFNHLDDRYKATLLKLQESMMRSQETRKSLSMKTFKTEKYARRKSVCGVLTSIEKSSRQVNHYLRGIQRQV